jgi:hypothetical protein
MNSPNINSFNKRFFLLGWQMLMILSVHQWPSKHVSSMLFSIHWILYIFATFLLQAFSCTAGNKKKDYAVINDHHLWSRVPIAPLPCTVTWYFSTITFQLCSIVLWQFRCYTLEVCTIKCYSLTQNTQVLPIADTPSHCVVCNVSQILISWPHTNLNGTQVHSLQENQ